MTSPDLRALLGAANNADLYEAIFSAQGLRYRREPYGFIAEDAPPPYYSCLTTTVADAVAAQKAEIAAAGERFGQRFGFKDSFCRHDMTDLSMRILFMASWITATPAKFRTAGMPPDWERVGHAEDLAGWEQAWSATGSPTSQTMFPSSLLDYPGFFFLGLRTGDGWSAGCVGNVSEGSVGISNIFVRNQARDVHRNAVEAVAALGLDLPIVGYESGRDLAAMTSLGFEAVGDLRIWVSAST
ncbi:MAG: hypothetical protein ACK4QP_19895 [Pseudorhizobium sp.]